MKSIKLNAVTRKEILCEILTSFSTNYFKKTAFANYVDLNTATNKAFKAGIKKAWLKAYGAYIFHIEQVPRAILSTASFSVAVDGEPNLTKALTDPALPGYSRGVDIIISREEHDAMFSEYIDLESMDNAYRQELKTFEKEVSQLLDSVTTTRQLIELWPSIEQYIPEHLINPDKRFNLPAVRVEDLDAKLS